MRAASSPAAKRVKTKCVAAVIAAAMNFMMKSHHPHAWTTPVDVRTAGCAMAMFRRQTAAANSTIRKGSAVGPTRWRGASMPAVGLGRVGWPPVGFGARQQARRGRRSECASPRASQRPAKTSSTATAAATDLPSVSGRKKHAHNSLENIVLRSVSEPPGTSSTCWVPSSTQGSPIPACRIPNPLRAG